MDPKDTENEIENLSRMLSTIQNLYYKKKEQLEELKKEISELREVLNLLNSHISGKSFHSAEEIYSKSLVKKSDKTTEEEYFIQEVSKEKFKGTNIKRKIFSKSKNEEEELLCVLNFHDFNKVEIKLIDPKKRDIKESSLIFINSFLKGALIKIKETNPEMSLNYDYLKNTDVIEQITIFNLKSIEEYDLITSKMRELLASEISTDN
ncbi:MAG: hypothetical protein JSV62_12435 [Promethearchaeota archaeon]|nr:MAG: hypothetical protein JSV62_12435 [Candidatus Lokiarchaeota archaeon]